MITTNSTPAATPLPAPTCNTRVATIYVDSTGRIRGGPDNGKLYIGVLNGLNDALNGDVIVGMAGAEIINGNAGNDLICANGGVDII